MAGAKVSGSSLCGPLGLSWLRLEGGPAPHKPSTSPYSHWSWRAEVVWARTAQMSYGRGHAFSQERLQTFAHALLSFWNAIPSSELNPLSFRIWLHPDLLLFLAHLSPPWSPHPATLPVSVSPGLVTRGSFLQRSPCWDGDFAPHLEPSSWHKQGHRPWSPHTMGLLGSVCIEQEEAPGLAVGSGFYSPHLAQVRYHIPFWASYQASGQL